MFAEWVNLVYIWQWLLVVYVFEADLAQRSFLFSVFLSSLVFLLLSFVFCFPISFFLKRSTLKGRLFISASFYSFRSTIFILPQYLPLVPAPSFYPQPSLHAPALPSCCRFSFCWLVLIGLKWVTSSITQSFKPSLNVSISWGSGGIVVLSFPPLATLLIGGETPGPMGVAEVWPPGKSAGLCQHSLQCTQRPQDQ